MKENKALKILIMIFSLIAAILFLINATVILKPEIVTTKVKPQKDRIEVEIDKNDKITSIRNNFNNKPEPLITNEHKKEDKTNSETTTEKKPSDKKTSKQKIEKLNASNIYKSKDNNLRYVRPNGVDPILITRKYKFSTHENKNKQIDKAIIPLDELNFTKTSENKPLNEYKTDNFSFYFTDYLYQEQIEPLIKQVKEYQKRNKRNIITIWHFEYEKDDSKYPKFIRLEIFSPQEKKDLNVGLDIAIKLHNTTKDKKRIDFKNNEFIQQNLEENSEENSDKK